MAMNTETIIVAGLRGSGKSTFTEKQLLPSFRSRGLDPHKDVEIKNFDHADDDIGLGTKPVCIVHFNTHEESDQYSVEEFRALREEKLISLLRNKPEPSKLYLCYTPDHILVERIEGRTDIDSEKLEAIINHSPVLDRAKDTVVNSVRIFISRNTILRNFFIGLRHRWNRIRS